MPFIFAPPVSSIYAQTLSIVTTHAHNALVDDDFISCGMLNGYVMP
jgi:hypothetical protein